MSVRFPSPADIRSLRNSPLSLSHRVARGWATQFQRARSLLPEAKAAGTVDLYDVREFCARGLAYSNDLTFTKNRAGSQLFNRFLIDLHSVDCCLNRATGRGSLSATSSNHLSQLLRRFAAAFFGGSSKQDPGLIAAFPDAIPAGVKVCKCDFCLHISFFNGGP